MITLMPRMLLLGAARVRLAALLYISLYLAAVAGLLPLPAGVSTETAGRLAGGPPAVAPSSGPPSPA